MNIRLLVTTFILLSLLTLAHFLAVGSGVLPGNTFTIMALPVAIAAATFALLLARSRMLVGKPVKRALAIAALALLLTALWVIATWNLIFGASQLGFAVREQWLNR